MAKASARKGCGPTGTRTVDDFGEAPMPELVSSAGVPIRGRVSLKDLAIAGSSAMPITNCRLGEDVTFTHPDLVNAYGCEIGAGTRVGPFVEIQKGSRIGARCKISSHSFVCEGVEIEDEVMIAHGVMFTNGLLPRATTETGELQRAGDWECTPTLIRRGASIGSNATIVCGVTVGAGAMVGAGAVVTHDVPEHAIVVGNPARVIGDVRRRPAAPHSNRLRRLAGLQKTGAA